MRKRKRNAFFSWVFQILWIVLNVESMLEMSNNLNTDVWRNQTGILQFLFLKGILIETFLFICCFVDIFLFFFVPTFHSYQNGAETEKLRIRAMKNFRVWLIVNQIKMIVFWKK